jgi:hypothetical protein
MPMLGGTLVCNVMREVSAIPRRLKGDNQLPKVLAGVTFRNGVEVTDTPKQSAA